MRICHFPNDNFSGFLVSCFCSLPASSIMRTETWLPEQTDKGRTNTITLERQLVTPSKKRKTHTHSRAQICWLVLVSDDNYGNLWFTVVRTYAVVGHPAKLHSIATFCNFQTRSIPNSPWHLLHVPRIKNSAQISLFCRQALHISTHWRRQPRDLKM